MVRNRGKIVGILGTAIIHLTAAIIFMTYKLGELKTKEQEIQKFEIELKPSGKGLNSSLFQLMLIILLQ